VEARLVRLGGEEQVATVARAEIHRERERGELKDLAPLAARERGRDLRDNLSEGLVVHEGIGD
jgi:hypothetical protein